MKRRGFILGLGSLTLYKDFVRRDETVYLWRTLRTSDYSHVSLVNCDIKRMPWFTDEIMIDCDAPNYKICDNRLHTV